jgi:hypothetical protein
LCRQLLAGFVGKALLAPEGGREDNSGCGKTRQAPAENFENLLLVTQLRKDEYRSMNDESDSLSLHRSSFSLIKVGSGADCPGYLFRFDTSFFGLEISRKVFYWLRLTPHTSRFTPDAREA